MRLFLGIAPLAIALLAAGCDQKPEERAQAAGEILPGTISDAMIATDQTRAEAPIAPRATGTGGPGKPRTNAAESNEAEGEPEPVTPTPEAPPTAAPAPAPAAT